MMIANRESFAVAARKRLPYDAEVEYLQSTGTQYIDTGVVITQTTKVCLDVSIVKSAGNFGCIDSTDARCHSDSSLAAVFRVGSVSDAYDFPVDTRVNVTVDIQNLVYTIYGISTSMTRPGGLPISTFGLFARNFRGTWTPCSMTVYAVQFYSSGVLVRDFIPVRVGRVGYLYDRVSGQLFGSAGTGDFVIGPDKTSWVNPYATDGLVAMWDGQWNAGGGVHDAAAATWTDLVGGAGLTLPSGWSVGATYVASGGNALALPDSVKTSLTIEAVFRLDSMGSGRSLLYFKNGADAGWRAATEHGISVRSNGQLNFVGAGAYTTGIAASTIYSAAVTYSSATSAASFAYINGSARTLSGGGMYGLGTASQNSGISVFSSYKFLGRIYAMRFYSRALTAAEIAANHAIDRERFGTP